jgi:A/G-specific adenine glycosylase
VADFDGEVPADLEALESLPGVGPYTARAVGAIAFGMAVGAVDTNVRRVLGRIIAGDTGRLGAAELQRLADAAVPSDRPGAWTHALMDLGATLCRPREPYCDACPARALCRYAQAPAVVARTAEDGVGKARRAGTGPAMAREIPAPFRSTSRWLRGRILDRLRELADDEWLILGDAIGGHGLGAVTAAGHALARDGLLELDAAALPVLRARLPLRPR